MPKINRIIPLVIIFVLLFGNISASAGSHNLVTSIVIDGVKEADWGDPLASDPIGDMSEPNLDLGNLYVVEDADNYYIGFDAFASNWGMAYGIYLDTNQVSGSGASSDPWGRAVAAVPEHLPEHTIYVYHDGGDWLQEAQLNHWNGSGWSYDSLISQGGAQGYGSGEDWIEYRVPKAALGNPSSIALEVFTTGNDGHAQDTVPSDPNVAYSAPDFNGDLTTLSEFVVYPVQYTSLYYVRGDFNGWGTIHEDPMYDDGTHGDVSAGDGIHTAQITIDTAGRYEFKVEIEDRSEGYPTSGNSWFITTSASELVTITFNTNTINDGWLPSSNIIYITQ